ncbi:MAG TPA: hypothetical protein DEH25_11450, partial [Chloroflexi bacterium]|nr:hypothetical protein [Chloroflexota bacterium]
MKKTILQNKGFRWGLLSLFVLAILIGSAVYYQSALAAAELTITPITWDIIGLDSNDETSGPNHFPVGARVCNVGDVDATNVTSTFVWDDNTNAAYIYERPLSLTEYTGSNAIATLTSDTTDNKNCVDFYYEVEVDRSDAAREKSRSYHITASATGLSTVSTPTPRKLFVEYLISQHRNATVDVQLDGVSVPAGGTMALVVGGTYDIKLVAATATQGYNQIESFINFANTIFKINKVSTIYSAYPTPHTDPDWYRQLYADGCTWDSDPNSPLYQSCLGTGKYGGDVAITYNITIIGGAGQTEALNSLIYDFSGSSFHYNADYAVGVRFAAIIDPTTATIAKAFSPSATTPGGVSTLTFTLSNPYGVPLTNASFDDTFPTNPGNMVVANPAVYSTTGCGTPTFAPAAGAPSISFSGGSIPANGTCVVNVQVTVPAAGDYLNISDNLFIDGADTGHHAEDTLTATTTAPPACTPGLELARWEFNGTSFDPTFVPSRAGSATQSYQGAGTSGIAIGGNPANSWGVTGGWAATNTGYPNPAAPYFQFQVN